MSWHEEEQALVRKHTVGTLSRVAPLDVQRVVGPGLGHVQESGVLVAQHRVVPQVRHPHGHQQRGAAEAPQQEEAVAVGAEAFVTLVRHHGDHGHECQEEKLCDLSFGHQVPLNKRGGPTLMPISSVPFISFLANDDEEKS